MTIIIDDINLFIFRCIERGCKKKIDDSLDILKQHWIIRISDGVNFWKSDRYSVWGINDRIKKTLEKANKGDILWFLINKSRGGHFVAVAEFDKVCMRSTQTNTSQCITCNFTNADFGWTGDSWSADALLYYKNRINIEFMNIIPEIRGNCSCRRSDTKKTKETLDRLRINLDDIYKEVMR